MHGNAAGCECFEVLVGRGGGGGVNGYWSTPWTKLKLQLAFFSRLVTKNAIRDNVVTGGAC